MAEPLSKTGQGLGKPQFHSPRLPALRVHSAHAAKALQWLKNVRDGLLEVLRENCEARLGLKLKAWHGARAIATVICRKDVCEPQQWEHIRPRETFW
jgi:hypothetical protein